jgi:hypothetical protein
VVAQKLRPPNVAHLIKRAKEKSLRNQKKINYFLLSK